MANQVVLSTKVKLVIFLLGIGLMVTTSLYFDAQHKLTMLTGKIKQLEESQILLMVPDAQAEAIASWLAAHPEQTQSLLETAVSGEQVSISMGPGVIVTEEQLKSADIEIPPLLDNRDGRMSDEPEDISSDVTRDDTARETKRDTAPKLAPQLVAEGKDGVRVIKLPHGGIRVTTREDK